MHQSPRTSQEPNEHWQGLLDLARLKGWRNEWDGDAGPLQASVSAGCARPKGSRAEVGRHAPPVGSGIPAAHQKGAIEQAVRAMLAHRAWARSRGEQKGSGEPNRCPCSTTCDDQARDLVEDGVVGDEVHAEPDCGGGDPPVGLVHLVSQAVAGLSAPSP